MLGEAWLNAAVADQVRGRIAGVYGAGMSLGFAIGPLGIPMFGTGGGLAFAVCASIVAFVSFVFAMLARRATVEPERIVLAEVFSFFRVAPTMVLLVVVFGMFDSIAIAILPLYFTAEGLSQSVAAVFVTVLHIGMIAAQPVLGMLLDRFDCWRVTTGCLSATSACFFYYIRKLAEHVDFLNEGREEIFYRLFCSEFSSENYPDNLDCQGKSDNKIMKHIATSKAENSVQTLNLLEQAYVEQKEQSCTDDTRTSKHCKVRRDPEFSYFASAYRDFENRLRNQTGYYKVWFKERDKNNDIVKQGNTAAQNMALRRPDRWYDPFILAAVRRDCYLERKTRGLNDIKTSSQRKNIQLSLPLCFLNYLAHGIFASDFHAQRGLRLTDTPLDDRRPFLTLWMAPPPASRCAKRAVS